MAKKISVTFIIEIGGKPVENVTKALNVVLERLKEEKESFKITESHLEEPTLDEQTTLYHGFLEVTAKFDDTESILNFILDYTPTSIEIIEPKIIELDANSLTTILNDMSHSILESLNKIRQLNAHIHMLNNKLKNK